MLRPRLFRRMSQRSLLCLRRPYNFNLGSQHFIGASWRVFRDQERGFVAGVLVAVDGDLPGIAIERHQLGIHGGVGDGELVAGSERMTDVLSERNALQDDREGQRANRHFFPLPQPGQPAS